MAPGCHGSASSQKLGYCTSKNPKPTALFQELSRLLAAKGVEAHAGVGKTGGEDRPEAVL